MIEDRDDVGVIDLGAEHGLLKKSAALIRGAAVFGVQRLDRDAAAQA
ncbi:MAG: hypothetical protein IPK80_14710 [Nannocystis sp.]|nr:hypothetical protein [Nannocystis sp.]